jgi:hypothetical protein
MRIKDIEEKLISVALEIAKEGKGYIFVIKEKSVQYEILIEQDVKSFNIFKEEFRRRLKLLAEHDGACIIDLSGNLIAYGVKISKTIVFPGFGTRHGASLTASLQKNTVIMASEEDRKIKVFKNGKMVMQIDALEKGIEKRIPEALRIFESIGVGTLGTLGTSIFVPTIGIALIPGIIFFGGSYWIFNKLRELESK